MTDATTAPIPYHELAETLKATRAALFAWGALAHGFLHAAAHRDAGALTVEWFNDLIAEVDHCERRLRELSVAAATREGRAI